MNPTAMQTTKMIIEILDCSQMSGQDDNRGSNQIICDPLVLTRRDPVNTLNVTRHVIFLQAKKSRNGGQWVGRSLWATSAR